MTQSMGYREVKADLLAQIRSGAFAPGALLPGEEELCRRYGAARATVNRAMRELAEDGLIERKRRAGSRVREAPLRQARFAIPLVRVEIESQGAAYRYALMRSRILLCPDWLRARMALPEGAQMRHLACLHFADERPYQFEDRWISLAAAPGARDADMTALGPNEWLVRNVPFSTAQISFSAYVADADAAQMLGCAPGEALFRVERQTWREGASITYVSLLYRAGHRMTTMVGAA